ncbi:hypothetical protein LRA02_22970 [Lentilactobacillus rapi]|uniref:Uncharacterized protein n=1 Tax=Lentilactobacillus rapi TaxID=481723 RepID=A0A512PQE1_9LACO|nr:hypothetical protein LRA02_22970 [Lentilactobacillus rapi]
MHEPSPKPTNNSKIENIGQSWKKIKATIAEVEINTLMIVDRYGDHRSNKYPPK